MSAGDGAVLVTTLSSCALQAVCRQAAAPDASLASHFPMTREAFITDGPAQWLESRARQLRVLRASKCACQLQRMFGSEKQSLDRCICHEKLPECRKGFAPLVVVVSAPNPQTPGVSCTERNRIWVIRHMNFVCSPKYSDRNEPIYVIRGFFAKFDASRRTEGHAIGVQQVRCVPGRSEFPQNRTN